MHRCKGERESAQQQSRGKNERKIVKNDERWSKMELFFFLYFALRTAERTCALCMCARQKKIICFRWNCILLSFCFTFESELFSQCISINNRFHCYTLNWLIIVGCRVFYALVTFFSINFVANFRMFCLNNNAKLF